jgi:BirA family transcriptional regulator, biotin operon repressor / biotin---[acetyl-CoA-carboxylase] ligase
LGTYVGAVDQGFATSGRGWHVEHVAETGSTNDDLAAAARRGAPSGTVLVTDHQTAGRGRLGRRWDAPPGASLLVSVLVRPSAEASRRLHGATQAVGLSALAACVDVAGFRPDLKWPNDLLVGTRKLAGVLSEALPGAVVIGMGLNVAWPPEPTDQAISASSAAGRPIGRDELLAAYLDHLDRRLTQWEQAPASLHADYRAALATLGLAVRVELATGTIEGIAVDVAPDGQLVVVSDGTQHLVSAADVVHLRGSVT